MTISHLSLCALLLVSAPVAAQTTTTKLDTVAGAQPIDNSTQAQDVKLRTDRDDRMTVAVRLGGAGPYQFLVDTGADRTAVSRELVTKLALPSAGDAQLHSISGVSQISTARVRNVELTQKPENIDAAVLDRAYIGADGIVGSDLLRSERVQFDFEKQTMTIVPSATRDFQSGDNAIIIRALRKNGRLVVTDAEVGDERLTIVLDTGSDLCIGNEALRQHLRADQIIDVGHNVELESVTGAKITGDLMSIRQMKIGGITLSNVAVVITDAHTFNQLGLEKKPAMLLGMNAMRAFRKVSIDFANKKFRVVLPEHSELETEVASRGGR
ncbi:MAG TPA: retroviral-like aspartic protease family protein [Sphingomicrobium sp.]|nr:retroviral-like aspartic protease family protein [Sphingomicrobium sp.]